MYIYFAWIVASWLFCPYFVALRATEFAEALTSISLSLSLRLSQVLRAYISIPPLACATAYLGNKRILNLNILWLRSVERCAGQEPLPCSIECTRALANPPCRMHPAVNISDSVEWAPRS